jgi:hypothetical protein
VFAYNAKFLLTIDLLQAALVLVGDVVAAADGLVGDGTSLDYVAIVGIRHSLVSGVLVRRTKAFCDVCDLVALLTGNLRLFSTNHYF